jgi:hypothetical protein
MGHIPIREFFAQGQEGAMVQAFHRTLAAPHHARYLSVWKPFHEFQD